MRHILENVTLVLATVIMVVLITLCIFGFGGTLCWLAVSFGHPIFAGVLATILLVVYVSYIASLYNDIRK